MDLKRESDVTMWRHKQRTPSNNDHHTPVQTTFIVDLFITDRVHNQGRIEKAGTKEVITPSLGATDPWNENELLFDAN